MDQADITSPIASLQARREREAKAAEDDGWTLVVGKAGRKKNTDAEGTAVGAVAPEVAARAAEEQARKKKKVQVLDFYRFQERDRRRSGEWNRLEVLDSRFLLCESVDNCQRNGCLSKSSCLWKGSDF
jgi:hypothetical protein